jgi:hypothetical protein
MQMKKQISPELKRFAGKVFLVVIGLILIAYVLASFTREYFGMILFVLGLLSTVIGTYLGNPRPRDSMSPRIRNINLQHRPSVEELFSQKMYEVAHSVPRYSMENVVAVAGLIAALISLLVLFGNPA